MTEARSSSGDDSRIALTDLVAYLDDYLRSSEYRDYGPNGLQIEGSPEVGTLVSGVSACAELFERAIARRADAVLVHHGLFWENLPVQLTGVRYRRVSQLIRHSMSLIAYHLPLDAHPEVGNNALAARALGLSDLERFGIARDMPIGYRGRFEGPLDLETVAERCRQVFDREPLVLGSRPARGLVTAAVVSGGAQSLLLEAIEAGVDLFITGEASEWVNNLAREAEICFVAAGHHATERLGVRALGDHLQRRFGIATEFVDVPNPV